MEILLEDCISYHKDLKSIVVGACCLTNTLGKRDRRWHQCSIPSMTLPVALLIASHNHESISHEIREIVGENLSILESLSCKCKGHLSRLRLVPPSPCCSPISEVGSAGSEASTSSYYTAKTYSYFSDTASDSDDGSDCQDLIENEAVRCLNILVDLVENVTIRFKESYIFKQDEVTINYQKRDILDLGKNIQEQFPIKHPDKSQKLVLNNPDVICIRLNCPMSGCGFQDLIPLI